MAEKDLPPFRKIADELRDRILSGKLRAGEKLQSENELKDQYGTTRVTVRKALALLKADGLLISEQGRGVFVRPRPNVQMLTTGANFRARRDTGVSNFNAEAAAQGLRPEQRIASVETVPAPADVAERLGVADGTEVIVRRRAFFVNDEPMQLVDGYYPADLFGGTQVAQPRRIRGGVSRLIEDPEGPIGQRITQFVEDLEIRMPTPVETDALKIPPGVPLARVLRTAHTSAGQTVEVLDSRVPCDRHVFRYVIDVP
ncbi:GntR family transcriptional regulator [Actinacidiphila bryophytorum]|uniref:GntR family transcriptional regulator n=1 Tax=Actinacidiphila bryophytorum TaxID=1436133 RepID=A0A9W4E9I6_9ACTN|nr:GntR family transcriptional regulator [Actinacidiphila bryophytorum]MBM9434453.1 GntR family transcriptional regulator [Actinacidiphila bryophytorum]MBN6541927.1 GntR family transcriptional regulator [Actinacidiphila bryophytorum]CAG7626263.1 GntR family transcriptional regulator [Actinacidiphila bryophytorum]